MPEIRKLKILEICPFSAGACGVWTRVLNESLEFVKLGHEVRVFSSNIVKGTKEIADYEEEIGGIKINRCPAKSLLFSKNVYSFNFEERIKAYSPDIVITHLLHPHSFKALKLCNQTGIPCYLVTHAPFNVKRKFPLSIATSIFYNIKVKRKLNKFTKVIAVTKWEMPYLKKLGLTQGKIVYIPNGIPSEFFKQKSTASKKEVLFLGRIAPVKSIETLLTAAKILPKVNFSIVGPTEKDYLLKLKDIIEKNNLTNVKIMPPVYDLEKKIKLIDEHKIFVLPSLREAMPQVLLEAMARARIVVASKTDGAKEIITNNRNGFLFDIFDSRQLAEIINKNTHGNKKIAEQAKRQALKYNWSILIKSYSALFNKK